VPEVLLSGTMRHSALAQQTTLADWRGGGICCSARVKRGAAGLLDEFIADALVDAPALRIEKKRLETRYEVSAA